MHKHNNLGTKVPLCLNSNHTPVNNCRDGARAPDNRSTKSMPG